MKLIRKGAEADIYLENDFLVKERVKKSYRAAHLDNFIRTSRTKSEARMLQRASRAGVLVPKIFEIRKFRLEMEFIDGKRVKDVLGKSNYRKICRKIGESVAKLHGNNVIHGDITTSNILVRDEELYFIDFGLGFFSNSIEDKATDLHLLDEAFESTHHEIAGNCFRIFLEAYKENYEEAGDVARRLKEIEKRGRYVKRG